MPTFVSRGSTAAASRWAVELEDREDRGEPQGRCVDGAHSEALGTSPTEDRGTVHLMVGLTEGHGS